MTEGVKTLLIVLGLIVVVVTILALLRKLPGRSFNNTSPSLGAGQLPLRDALHRDVTHIAGTIGERNVIMAKG